LILGAPGDKDKDLQSLAINLFLADYNDSTGEWDTGGKDFSHWMPAPNLHIPNNMYPVYVKEYPGALSAG